MSSGFPLGLKAEIHVKCDGLEISYTE